MAFKYFKNFWGRRGCGRFKIPIEHAELKSDSAKLFPARSCFQPETFRWGLFPARAVSSQKLFLRRFPARILFQTRAFSFKQEFSSHSIHFFNGSCSNWSLFQLGACSTKEVCSSHGLVPAKKFFNSKPCIWLFALCPSHVAVHVQMLTLKLPVGHNSQKSYLQFRSNPPFRLNGLWVFVCARPSTLFLAFHMQSV